MIALRTAFPRWSRARLERVAREHAAAVAMAYGDFADVTAPSERLVVNMLRHEFTDYDDDQSARRHQQACDAIADRYPWLRDECLRQVQARKEREHEAALWEVAARAEVERTRQWRRQRVTESHTSIGAISVGDEVSVRVRGHDRIARVTKVGRSRVTVHYAIKNGQAREALVYARDVTPTRSAET